MSTPRTTSGRRLNVALAGNPNAGKTTIFNLLTGAAEHVGNYPGVTVEKIVGHFRHEGVQVDVVDLPGTYSLTARSLDELVARRFVIDDAPDVVVHVVDASNLERNLYLAVQLMELRVPLILALNKVDLAEAQGFALDTELLARLFGVTIVKIVGSEGVGGEALRRAIVEVGTRADPPVPAEVRYGREVERELRGLVPLCEALPAVAGRFGCRWVALKLLEGDSEVRRAVRGQGEAAAPLVEAAREAAERIRTHFRDAPEIVIADQRYGFISGACQEAVKRTSEARHNMSDKIDEIVTSRTFGLPIFLLLMYLTFRATFTLADPFMGWIESGIGLLREGITAVWPGNGPLLSLVTDGILGGVGGVLVFLPNILLLFAAIALLEDSGYMARAAFVMDGLMHRIGLHGKSFIPMVIGFGCTVPAIMATRILESRRDRLTTMLVLPLISCGARLPIYTLFLAALFPLRWRTPLLMLLYLIGVALAVLMAKVLRSTVFRGQATAFVMELPPYRMPPLRAVLRHTWERGWLFLRKAGTVILGISMLLWVMTNYPRLPEEQRAAMEPEAAAAAALQHSVAGRIGRTLEPALRHAGFDWKASTALIGAFAAKELFVAQLGIVNALGDADADSFTLRETLRRDYNVLQAFCIMLFCLISAPCVVTVVTTWKESGSWRWAALQLSGLTVLAYAVCVLVYQAGRLVTAVV